MSDREPRSRRKRKAAQEKAALEPTVHPKLPSEKETSKGSRTQEDVQERRSSTVKIAFVLVFTALGFALAAVIFSLYGVTGHRDADDSLVYPQAEPLYEDDIAVQNEINEFLDRPVSVEENYATVGNAPSESSSSSQALYGSADESHASAENTVEIQPSMSEPVAVEMTHAESVVTVDAPIPVHTVIESESRELLYEDSSETEASAVQLESLLSTEEAAVADEVSIAAHPEIETSSFSESTPRADVTTHQGDDEIIPTTLVQAGGSDFPEASHASSATVESVVESLPSTFQEEPSEADAQGEFIERHLEEAEELLEKFPEKALAQFNSILGTDSLNPRATYGKGRALEKLAEIKKSNAIVEDAIKAYLDTMSLPKVPNELYLEAGKRCADRMRFLGAYKRALRLQLEMSEKLPENVGVKNQIAVSYLMMGRGKEAAKVLEEVLQRDKENGFAKVHYGFILKTERNDMEGAIKYMREGIATKEPGVTDGRFYFHLGDALARTGRAKEAEAVYKEGVKEGLFFSVYQRSLYNVRGLKAQPWWRAGETPYAASIRELERNWKEIRDEAISLMDDRGFLPESENLRDTGDWRQFEMFSRGRKLDQNCQRAPKTCALVSKIPDAANCKRGQVKFSIMHPGTHVWAHTGPTNCRLRAHLGLVVPPKVRIRVANDTRTWKVGKFIIFDDSFEHEVWHEGESFRLVLIMDLWHPDLTPHQKATLAPI
ncbi:aspartyl/asparaginyl beta-hydroxylase-like isoform X1 [Ornithodoros turicata]|uniref:aspartyl/asparaginyl beta-hydroxylase-like isoform X1 n=1 Tax=Ornithodoros turicata TaxID=34597 RepID=UPI0031397D72